MSLPSADATWQAIHSYLQAAYPGPPPRAVQARLDALRATSEDSLYASALFERGAGERLFLRLGNHFYPHMKLCLEAAPLGGGWVFRVDTHDRHACPAPTDPDYSAFCALMERNQEVAQVIEAAWTAQGLPTFKQLLREDLARRQRAQAEEAR